MCSGWIPLHEVWTLAATPTVPDSYDASAEHDVLHQLAQHVSLCKVSSGLLRWQARTTLSGGRWGGRRSEAAGSGC